jgi:hypothetical protein
MQLGNALTRAGLRTRFALLRAIIAMAAILLPMSALAETTWMPTCRLSADRSTLEVVAANPSDQKYYCQAWCRMKITGERPVQKFDCTFNLASNVGEKVMCRKDGGSANYFSEMLPTRSTCVPR